MPRDAVSRTSNVERTGRHKWVKNMESITESKSIQSEIVDGISVLNFSSARFENLHLTIMGEIH